MSLLFNRNNAATT